MLFLILAEASDATAVAVAALLQRRHGPSRVHVRTATEVALAPCWTHRLSSSGARTDIGFHDGTSLDAVRPTVILNRLDGAGLPPGRLSSADREYAQAELTALIASWLAGAACRVVNPPSSAATTTCTHRPLTWLGFAARAGLPTPTLAASTSTRKFPHSKDAQPRADLSWRSAQTAARLDAFGWCGERLGPISASALVIGDRVLGALPEPLAKGSLRLARLAQADIVRVAFAPRANEPHDLVFAAASAFPQATAPEEVALLAELLEAS